MADEFRRKCTNWACFKTDSPINRHDVCNFQDIFIFFLAFTQIGLVCRSRFHFETSKSISVLFAERLWMDLISTYIKLNGYANDPTTQWEIDAFTFNRFVQLHWGGAVCSTFWGKYELVAISPVQLTAWRACSPNLA